MQAECGLMAITGTSEGEPLRFGVVQLTRWSLDRADRNDGHRNLWLRALDLVGLGFDS